MTDKDEDDDPGTISNARFPCLPSLVALQQMRNRLHLAHLGKKLMRWSALASGREMRRIGALLVTAYEGFAEEYAEANIMLARCRFHFPSLNQVVIEDIQKEAALVITTSTKSAGGVKLTCFHVEEKEPAPAAYPYLGIGVGGQMITDTKRAWAALLKKLILILELRESFIALDYSFKSNTKKENVLGKLIIPRLNATIHYILQELEETQREELFRIKKVVQYKQRAKAKKAPKPPELLPEPEPAPLEPIIEGIKLDESEIEPPNIEPPEIEPPKIEPPRPPKVEPCSSVPCSTCSTLPPPSPIKMPRPRPKPIPKPIPMTESGSTRIKKPISCIGSETGPDEIELIQQNLEQTHKLGKGLVDSGHSQFEPFVKHLNKLRIKLSRLNKTENLDILKQLSSSISNLIKTSNEFKNNIQSTNSCECFFAKCSDVQQKICSFITKAEADVQDNLNALLSYVNQLQLLSSPSTAKNLNVPPFYISFDDKNKNLQKLHDQLSEMETKGKDIDKDKKSTNDGKFLDACVDFKKKIEKYKGNYPKGGTELDELIKQLDEAIALSSKAQETGLIGKNVNKFILSCENLKKLLLESDETNKQSPHTPAPTRQPSNISETLDTFLNTCKTTEQHIKKSESNIRDQDEMLNKTEDMHRKIIDYIRGSGSVRSVNTPKHTASLESIGKPLYDQLEKPKGILMNSPISSIHSIPTRSKKMLIETKVKMKPHSASTTPLAGSIKNLARSLSNTTHLSGSRPIIVKRESLTPSSHSLPSSSKSKESKATSLSSDTSDIPPEVDNLGAFENKVKKVVKIKRVLNDDGTVSEQVDTMTVKLSLHDPDKFSLGDDVSTDYGSITSSEKPSQSASSKSSYESQEATPKAKKDNDKDVRHCTIPDQPNFTFLHQVRKAKSEIPFSVTQKSPFLRHSISEIIGNNKSHFILVLDSQCA